MRTANRKCPHHSWGHMYSIVVVLIATPLMLGGGGGPKNRMSLDFEPQSGSSYTIEWKEVQLHYDDVKHFVPSISLDHALETAQSITFEIMVDRSWRRDPKIGWFLAEFDAGAKTPKQIKTPNNIPGVTNPIQSPPVTEGSFWLGCTKKGRVKGNESKDNDSHAVVYFQVSSGLYVDGRRLTDTRSVSHVVECKKESSGGSGSGGGSAELECTSMQDCPRGDCVPGAGIGHYECLRNKCRCLPD